MAYLHDKGSFRNVFHSQVRARQKRLRQALLRGLGSVGCVAAITKGDACDVCSTHFTALPHQHTRGNMWLARCSYVKRLIAPPAFQRGMDAYWGALGFDKGGTLMGTPWVGTGRYAMEHWVHSHPSVRPCDVSEKPPGDARGHDPALVGRLRLDRRYRGAADHRGESRRRRARSASASMA